MANKGINFFDPSTRKRIQRFWRSGRRKIEIQGRTFVLSKAEGQTTLAFTQSDKTPKGKRQSYILVKPESGKQWPVAQIEILQNR